MNCRAAAIGGLTEEDRGREREGGRAGESVGWIRNTGRVNPRVFPIMHLVLHVTITVKPAAAAVVDIRHSLLHTSRPVSRRLSQIGFMKALMMH